MYQLLNHCVLVQWLSDRALRSVMLRRHRLLMCPSGEAWPVTIRAGQPLGTWTDRLISADMFYHRSSTETWIIWTADSTVTVMLSLIIRGLLQPALGNGKTFTGFPNT